MKKILLSTPVEIWLCSLIGDDSKDHLENNHSNDVFLAPPWLTQTPLLRRQYLVLVPSQLYAGVTEKACVVLNHLNETVELTVTLEYEMQSRNLLTDLEAKHSFYCSSFMVSIPPWEEGEHYRESVLVDALHSDPQQ